MPWLIALRVVSLPATTSSTKNEPSSCVGEPLAVDLGVDQRGGEVVGRVLARGARPRSCTSVRELRAGLQERRDDLRRVEVGDVLGIARAEDDVGAVEDELVLALRDAHHVADDLERQRRGDLGHEVARALLDRRRRRSRAATRCTSSSTRCSMRGVKPRETMRRSRAWRGSSMLIIEPKNSRKLAAGRPMLRAAARAEELRVAAHLEDVGVPHERPEARALRQDRDLGLLVERDRTLARAASRRRPRAPPAAAARSRDRRAGSRRRTARASASRAAPPRAARGRVPSAAACQARGMPWTSRFPPRSSASSTSSTPSSSARSRRSSASTSQYFDHRREYARTDWENGGAPAPRVGGAARARCAGAPTPPATCATRCRRSSAARTARTWRWRSSASTSPRKGLGLHNDLQNESSIVGNFPTVLMMLRFGTRGAEGRVPPRHDHRHAPRRLRPHRAEPRQRRHLARDDARVRDGDDWVINGAKRFNSGLHQRQLGHDLRAHARASRATPRASPASSCRPTRPASRSTSCGGPSTCRATTPR